MHSLVWILCLKCRKFFWELPQDYKPVGEDRSCTVGTGNIEDISSIEQKACRADPNFRDNDQEQQGKPCIFPFMFDGELVNECIQLGKKYMTLY